MGKYSAKPSDGAVWITGASEGIGKAVALEMANEGYTVYASARSQDKLTELADAYSGKGKLIALPLDVTDRKACERCVKQIVDERGALAVAILNAGTFAPVIGKAMAYASFDRTIDVNVNGVLNCLLPRLKK